MRRPHTFRAPPPPSRDRQSAQILRRGWVGALGVLVLLAALALAGDVPPAGAARRQGSEPAVTAPASVPAGDGSGPYLTGRTEPSTVQRVVDSLIWLWVLAVLVLAPALWVWSGRRGRADTPAGGRPGPD